jgi:hypothetical protein
MELLIITYLAIGAATKLMICIIKYLGYIAYLPTIVAGIIFCITLLIRYFFFFTPREILIEDITKKCDRWYTARKTNKLYWKLLQYSYIVNGKSLLYYDYLYCKLYYTYQLSLGYFQHQTFSGFIIWLVKRYVKKVDQRFRIFFTILHGYKKQRIAYLRKVGYFNSILIRMGLKKLPEPKENEAPIKQASSLFDYMAFEYYKIGVYQRLQGKSATKVPFSPFYSKFRYLVLHYALIILWFLPLEGSLGEKWKNLLLELEKEWLVLFQKEVTDSYIAEYLKISYYNLDQMGADVDTPVISRVIRTGNLQYDFLKQNVFQVDLDIDYSYLLSCLPYFEVDYIGPYSESVLNLVLTAQKRQERYTSLIDIDIWERWIVNLTNIFKDYLLMPRLHRNEYSFYRRFYDDIDRAEVYQYSEFAKFTGKPDMEYPGWGPYYPYRFYDVFEGFWETTTTEEYIIKERFLTPFTLNTFVVNESTFFFSIGFSLMLIFSIILLSRRLQIYLMDERPAGREEDFSEELLGVDGKFKQFKKETYTITPVGGPFNLLFLFAMITVFMAITFNLLDKYLYFIIWLSCKLLVNSLIFF